MKKRVWIGITLVLVAVPVLWLGGGIASASHTSTDPAVVGELGPLIPFHKDAIHAGLGWTDGKGDWDGWYNEEGKGHKKKRPKICFWMRPSEYQGIHLVDPLKPPGPGALRTDTFEKFVYGNNFTAGKDLTLAREHTGWTKALPRVFKPTSTSTTASVWI